MKTTLTVLSVALLSAFTVSVYADTQPVVTPSVTPTQPTTAPAMAMPATAAPQTQTIQTTATTTTQTASSTAISPVAMDIAGKYTCSGTDPYRKNNYSNVPLTISKTGDTYKMVWDFESQGMNVIMGTGIMNIKEPSVLAAVFWDSKDIKSVGVLTYHREADGSLSGDWSLPNQELVGNETCTKVN